MNTVYAAKSTNPAIRLDPRKTIATKPNADIHTVASSKRTKLSVWLMGIPVTATTPMQIVKRNMLLPAVVATTMPPWPLEPLITEMNFSGRVVAKAITVKPKTVPDSCNDWVRAPALWAMMEPDRESASSPRRS
jgi:hypothetical protein